MTTLPKINSNARGRPTASAAKLIPVKILASAEYYFVEVGYEATTMDAVARHAQVSKRTLYERYPNKLSLFSETATQIAEAVNRDLSELRFDKGDLATKLRTFAEQVVSIILRSNFVVMQQIILTERSKFQDLARKISANTQAILAAMVVELISEEIPYENPLAPKIDSEIFVEMVITTLVRDRLKQARDSEPGIDHSARRIDIFVKGIMHR